MHPRRTLLLLAAAAVASAGATAGDYSTTPTKADMEWLLPARPPSPPGNQPTKARIALGKMLFFDRRLSTDSNLSCAGCHDPMFGWSDGLSTAKGAKSKVLGRASPALTNSGYNGIQMWDGRKGTLEDQAMGPMESMDEMAMDLKLLFAWLERTPGYKDAFARAYPGEAIDDKTVSKALASFERTIVSNNSPFDRWLRGDNKSMTPRQVRGFRLFSDPGKANCTACHHAPNFTDNGFHNIGLASYARPDPDMGRFVIKPVAAMRGAFKTPTLRDVALTAPYFHDGSAKTLMDAIDHYNRGSVSATDRSPQIRPLNLTRADMEDIAAFLQALTAPARPFVLPVLPPN
jgi:cytochrome c peroxidase